MFYALVVDADGNGMSARFYPEEPTSYPSNEIPCTEAQAKIPAAYQVVNGQIVESLSYAKTSQIALLRSACQSAITGDFTSSALGSVYSYPSDANTQTNINSAAGNPSGGEIRCTLTPTAPSWPLVAHTQSQAQTVLTALMAWVNGCQNQLDTLIAQVNAATTVSEVRAITWTAP